MSRADQKGELPVLGGALGGARFLRGADDFAGPVEPAEAGTGCS